MQARSHDSARRSICAAVGGLRELLREAVGGCGLVVWEMARDPLGQRGSLGIVAPRS
jgi:hypothetical protein